MKTDEKKHKYTVYPDGCIDFGQDKFPMYIPGSHHENLTPEEKERRHKAWQKARKALEGWGEK